jgi:hypothetical protein
MKHHVLYLVILAIIIFLGAVGSLILLAPEINPLRQGISFYALTKYEPLIGTALVFIGCAGVLLGIVIWQRDQPVPARIGSYLLMGWGFSSALAGIFPLDPPGAEPTLSGSIHNFLGLNFLVVVCAALMIEWPTPSTRKLKRGLPAGFWLAWGLLLSAVLLFVFNGPLVSQGVGGLAQRWYWLVLCTWLLYNAREYMLLQT